MIDRSSIYRGTYETHLNFFYETRSTERNEFVPENDISPTRCMYE